MAATPRPRTPAPRGGLGELEALGRLLPGSERWQFFVLAGGGVSALIGLVLSDAGTTAMLGSAASTAALAVLALPRFRHRWATLAAPMALVGVGVMIVLAGPSSGFSTFLALVILHEALLHPPRRVLTVLVAAAALRIAPVLLLATPPTEWSRVAIDLGVWALLAGAALTAVAQLRRNADVIADTERRLTSLSEATGAAVWICDRNGRVVDGNTAGHDLTGWTIDDLRGHTLRRISPPERYEADLVHWFGAIRGDAQLYETTIVRRDGAMRHVQVSLLPLGGEGADDGFFAVAHDVTAVVEARAIARRNEERFRLLAETARVGIYSTSLLPEPRFEYVNATFVEMTGVPAATWLADATTARAFIHPDDAAAILDRRVAPIDDRPSPMTYRWHHPDGSIHWHEALEVPVRDPSGVVVGLQGIVNDVTARVVEQERMAAALEKEQLAVERLERLHELKTTFLQSVSHELRTPLTSVLGFTRTIRDHGHRLEADRRSDLLVRAITNAEKLERLLRDLLDVDRLERGAATLTRQRYDVTDLVLRVFDELEVGRERIQLDLVETIADVDGPKVERIVENLIHNALRHTPADTPVEVVVRPLGSGVELSVSDRGDGVPDELKTRVFEPFEQGPSSATAASPGTGIGLSLVARFAELHGGSAEILDRPGGGAVFRLVLPGCPIPTGPAASDETGEEVALLADA